MIIENNKTENFIFSKTAKMATGGSGLTESPVNFTQVHEKREGIAQPSFPFIEIQNQVIESFHDFTIAQAAVLLDMHEGCIHELIEIGSLPCKLEGSQRLINRDRLLEYKDKRERRRAFLNEMVRMDQEMGLYD